MERQIIQKSFTMPLVSVTNVRPSAIIESDCHRRTNEALLYLDVVLHLIRDPENSSQTVLLMEVALEHWKGAREKHEPVTRVYQTTH